MRRHWPTVLLCALASHLLLGSALLAADQPICNAIFMQDIVAVRDAIPQLSSKAQLDRPVCDSEFTPLAYAALRDYGDGVAELLRGDANVDATSGGTKISAGTTPLMLASANRHLDIVKRLVGKGADVNAVDKKGRSVLWFVANNAWLHPDDLSTFQYLASHGACLDLDKSKKPSEQCK